MAGVLSKISLENLGFAGSTAIPANPDPKYRYLRIEVVGRPPALLVLGYVDNHAQGEIEVWYSAKNEVIKIQNGRIISTTGLELDWRAVSYPYLPPAWSDTSTQVNVYQRSRDEMPGHRYDIQDRIEQSAWLGLPPIVLSASLPIKQANSYHWFRETAKNLTGQPLPPSWFALGSYQGRSIVVYSEQCLSATFCLKLQRWPIQENIL